MEIFLDVVGRDQSMWSNEPQGKIIRFESFEKCRRWKYKSKSNESKCSVFRILDWFKLFLSFNKCAQNLLPVANSSTFLQQRNFEQIAKK